MAISDVLNNSTDLTPKHAQAEKERPSAALMEDAKASLLAVQFNGQHPCDRGELSIDYRIITRDFSITAGETTQYFDLDTGLTLLQSEDPVAYFRHLTKALDLDQDAPAAQQTDTDPFDTYDSLTQKQA